MLTREEKAKTKEKRDAKRTAAAERKLEKNAAMEAKKAEAGELKEERKKLMLKQKQERAEQVKHYSAGGRGPDGAGAPAGRPLIQRLSFIPLLQQ